jgi:sulfite exporter TauE/SafE
LLMFLFLLGTLPALLGLNVIYTVLDGSKFFFNKLKPIIMVSMGVLLIIRGLTPLHQPSTSGNAVVVCK